MTDKQIIDICPYQGECSVSGCKRNDDGCFVRQLFEERNRAENRIVELNKSIQAKEQEYEKLRQYHNKCCEEFEKEKKEWLEKYNQVSRDFYSGKYCNAEKCQQLDQLKAENDELKEELNKKYSVSGFNVIFMKEHIHELQDQVLELTEIIKKQNGEYDKLRQSYEHTSNSLHCFIKKGSELRYANIAMKNKYRKEVNKQRESIERFKTFLNELKELLNHCSKQDICTTCDYSEECNLGDEEIPTYDICKFLLNKINQHQ